MRIINKVKYDNIFTKFIWPNQNNFTCFICDKKVINYYADLNMKIHYKERLFFYPDLLRICTKCVKSPIEAEDIIIPLLKVLYGGIVTVQRNYYKTCGYKLFKY